MSGGKSWVMRQQGWIFKSLRSLGLESEVGRSMFCTLRFGLPFLNLIDYGLFFFINKFDSFFCWTCLEAKFS